MANYIAGIDIGQTKYHLRRRNYLQPYQWDPDEQFLNVRVNGNEVEYNLHSGGSIVNLVNQPDIGARVTLTVEDVPTLPLIDDVDTVDTVDTE